MRFQPQEGPSRGLLRDCGTDGSYAALQLKVASCHHNTPKYLPAAVYTLQYFSIPVICTL